MRVLFFLRLVLVLLVVQPLRWLRGRRRPTWTLREELVWTAVRQVVAVHRHGVHALRRIESSLPVRSPLFKLVGFERQQIGGVDCLCAEPHRIATEARTILFLHGGGYAIGSSDGYREPIARLALDCRARVIAPDYRLGPEHRFPAAQDDCLAVAKAATENGSRWVMAGDSAGGGLVLATLVSLRDAQLPLPSGAVLFSPWVDPLAEGGSMEENADEDTIDPEFLETCLQAHVGDGPDAEAALADPRLRLLEAELAELPPLLIQVGDAEIFLDQDRALAEKASAEGVQVRLKVYEDLFHTFQNWAGLLPQSEAAVAESTAFLRSRLDETR